MAPLYERVARVGSRCWSKRRLELSALAGRRQATHNAWSKSSYCRVPAAPENTQDRVRQPGMDGRGRHYHRVRATRPVLRDALTKPQAQSQILLPDPWD